MKAKKQGKKFKWFFKEKKHKEDLTKMSQKEKKHFLSMDLIERMIRVEQRVGATFNKEIPYKSTEYFKSLPSNEKIAFEHYLITKKRKKCIIAGVFVLSLLSLFIFQSTMTSNAIKDVVGSQYVYNYLELGVSVFLIGLCFFLLLSLVYKKIRNRRHDFDFGIIDKVYLRKHAIKHFR